jgi:uncharacterized membrane protein HdeD (DUF308 family)
MHRGSPPIPPHGYLPVLVIGVCLIVGGALLIAYRRAVAEMWRGAWDGAPSIITKLAFFGTTTSEERQEILALHYLIAGSAVVLFGVFLTLLFFV